MGTAWSFQMGHYRSHIVVIYWLRSCCRGCWFIVTIRNHIFGRFCSCDDEVHSSDSIVFANDWNSTWFESLCRLSDSTCGIGRSKEFAVIDEFDSCGGERWRRNCYGWNGDQGTALADESGRCVYGTDADDIASSSQVWSSWSSWAASHSTHLFQDQCVGLGLLGYDATLYMTSDLKRSMIGSALLGSPLSCVCILHLRWMLQTVTSRCCALTSGRGVAPGRKKSGNYRERFVSCTCGQKGNACQNGNEFFFVSFVFKLDIYTYENRSLSTLLVTNWNTKIKNQN